MMSILIAIAMLAGLDRAALHRRCVGRVRGRAPAQRRRHARARAEPDWTIIDSDGRPISRERFLAVLRSGELSHSEMRSSEEQVRIIGDTAIEIARAEGKGTYRGQPFSFTERSTDVWTWVKDHWGCALTQLTRIAPPPK